jgi:amicyanin
MKTHMLGLIVGGALLALLALGGVGAAAMSVGWMRPGWGHPSMMGGYVPDATPSQYGPGGMMGPGDMMGGYGAQHPGQATPATGVTQVTIQNFAFQPASIQVKVGTTVTWTNQDTAAHTVTFRNGMGASALLRQGQSFSDTFTSSGTYAYYCAVHPYMTGQVAVTA